MRRSLNLAVFDTGSRAYDLLTGQELWRHQIARVLDHVPDSMPSPASSGDPPRRVLDLGCGPGVSTFVLAQRLGPDCEVVGLDLSSEMIARAREHHARRFPELCGVRFMVADATRLPFEDGAFDLAVGHSFLYLVPDRRAVLGQVRRVLAPGGRLVLMEPCRSGSLLAAGLGAVGELPRLWEQPLATSRFVASMVAWRLFSGAAGRLEPAQVERLFHEAGLEGFGAFPTLGGLGMHCVGRAARLHPP